MERLQAKLLEVFQRESHDNDDNKVVLEVAHVCYQHLIAEKGAAIGIRKNISNVSAKFFGATLLQEHKQIQGPSFANEKNK